MAGRIEQLNAANGGINRQRTKGGASKSTLYDLVNCFVDASGAIVSRPGTVQAYLLPAGTKGLCAFGGALVVFSHQVVTGLPAGVKCEVLSHPSAAAQTIKEIHFAGPFLSYLYVVAEFSGGDVFHYWLQAASVWKANMAVTLGQMVQPTTPNGLVYRASRLNPPAPLWEANAARSVGDIVEPTEADGFQYKVIQTIGSNPKSGPTEPDWNDKDGARTIEDVDASGKPAGTTGPTTPPTKPPPDITGRYGNSGGSIPGARIQIK